MALHASLIVVRGDGLSRKKMKMMKKSSHIYGKIHTAQLLEKEEACIDQKS